MIIHGDCLRELKLLPDNSVDSIVTDPPYGLSFMGKKWDYDVPTVEIWREALRVIKPGGHLLSFAGTRTYHRMACNIEDAGFEIRDQIMWLYGSGFPKSHDVSKAIDKAAGAEREVIGTVKRTGSRGNSETVHQSGGDKSGVSSITAPATEAAKQWQGWDTALKPANEPIVVARKPLEAGLTVAANVMKWGTGALNIDESRIEGRERTDYGLKNAKRNNVNAYGADGSSADFNSQAGRWPANVLLDEEAAKALDEQSGAVGGSPGVRKNGKSKNNSMSGDNLGHISHGYNEPKSGASRFFYVAKASKRERGEGNVHPTVKPIALMEYLIKLVTPENGTVLDPFLGSGTTLLAAIKNDFAYIGIEREADYVAIARARIKSATSENNEPETDLETNEA